MKSGKTLRRITCICLMLLVILCGCKAQPGNEPTAPVSDEDALRQALAAPGTDTIILDGEITASAGYDVNGTKTLKGGGRIVFTGGNQAFKVCEGASLSVEGICVDGDYALPVGVSVQKGATLTWKDGGIERVHEYGVFSYGKVTLENVHIEETNNWVFLRSGADAVLKNVDFYKSGSTGITVEAGAKLEITGENTLLERPKFSAIKNSGELTVNGGRIHITGDYAIDNYGVAKIANLKADNAVPYGSVINRPDAVAEIRGCSFGDNKHHVRNQGTMKVSDTRMLTSAGSAIYNDIGAVMELDGVYIWDSSYHGIYNENGKLTGKNVTCELMVSAAIQNKGGNADLQVDGLVINECNTAIMNSADNINTYGKLYAKHMTASGADSYNVICYGGYMELVESTLNPSVGYSVYARAGEVVLDSVRILGTTTSGKGGVAVGSKTYTTPEVTIKGNTVITGCASRGIVNYNKLTIYGCDIYGNNTMNNVAEGAGIYSVGDVYMYGGRIHDNSASKYGGGVRLTTADNLVGRMYMYGGSIDHNYAAGNGGGVSVGTPKNIFVMHGGKIESNRAAGKGDAMLLNGTFQLYGADSMNDNDVYLYADTSVVEVKTDSLKLREMTLTPNACTEGRKVAVFPDSKTAQKLAGKFTSRNQTFSVADREENLVLVHRIADITAPYSLKNADTVRVTTFEELKAAVEGASGARIVQVAADIVMTGTVKLAPWSTVKLTDDGTPRTLLRGTGGNLFVTQKESCLVLGGKGGLTLDGDGKNGTVAQKAMIMTVNYGKLVMEDGAKLANAYNNGTASDNGVRGGAVNLAPDGYFVMNGGVIENCSSAPDDTYNTNFCAVYVSSTAGMTVNGGRITNCTDRAILSYGKVYMHGGAIDNCQNLMAGGGAIRGPIFVMDGGVIENCVSTHAGSAVLIQPSTATPNGYFLLDGGTIRNNLVGTDKSTATVGGAIHIANGAHLEFLSGSVSDNRAEVSGAGIYNQGSAYLGKNASVTGNTAGGAGAAIYNAGTLTLETGRITDNTGTTGAVYCDKGSLSMKNVTLAGNRATQSGAGAAVVIGQRTDSVTLDGKITVSDSEGALRLGDGVKITLADGFSAASQVSIHIDGEATVGRDVLDGKTSAVSAFRWANAPEDYVIDGNGCISSYAVQAENGDKYLTLTEALKKAKGTLTLLRDLTEDVQAKDGVVTGGYAITGTVTVSGNLTLDGPVLSGDAVLTEKAVLSLAGDSSVTGNVRLVPGAALDVAENATGELLATVTLWDGAKAGDVIVTGDTKNKYDAVYVDSDQWRLDENGALTEITARVQIGETTYLTLEEALAAAGDGDTLILLAHSRVDALTVDKNLTVDGSGRYAIRGNLTVAEGKTLTLQGGAKVTGVTLTKDSRLGVGDRYGAQITELTVPADAAIGTQVLTGETAENYKYIKLAGTEWMLYRDGCLYEKGVATLGETLTADSTVYPSFEKAYAAAQDGDTLLVLDDIVLADSLTVKKAITVASDGNDRIITGPSNLNAYLIVVDASGKEVAFRGTDSGRLILAGAGDTVMGKGLLYPKAATGVTLEKCVLRDVTQDGSVGGAIYSATKLTAIDCVFENCYAKKAAATGGAIHTTAGLTLTGCTFTGNRAVASGGAFYVQNQNTVTVTDCVFTDNTAEEGFGGAIGIGTAASTLKLAGKCEFVGNRAKGTGTHFGGAVMSCSNLTISGDVVMTGNDCTGYAVGDALSINTSGVYAFIIEENARLWVHCNPDGEDTGSDVCIKGGNAATPTVREGGIYMDSCAASVTDEDGQRVCYAQLEEAIAQANGAAVCLNRDYDGQLTVQESTVELTGKASVTGNVMVAAGATLQAEDLTVTGNVTVNGTLALGGGTKLTGTVTVNTANGGNIRIVSPLTASGAAAVITVDVTEEGTVVATGETAELLASGAAKLNIAGSQWKLDENGKLKPFGLEATVNGVTYESLPQAVAALTQDGMTLTVLGGTNEAVTLPYSVTMDGNAAMKGQLRVASGKTLTLSGSVSADEVLLESGASLRLGTDASVQVLKVSDDFADGAAVVNDASRVTLESGKYFLNGDGTLKMAVAGVNGVPYESFEAALAQANTLDGATLTVYQDVKLAASQTVKKSMTITGSAVITNHEKSDGYGLVISAGTVKISGLTFTGYGKDKVIAKGFINLQSAATLLTLENCVFKDLAQNTSNGGAIYSGSNLEVIGCTFRNCHAMKASTSGGAIYHANDKTLTVTGSTFTGCSATAASGAVHSNLKLTGGKVIQITDCIFSGNAAGTNGGAMHIGGENTVAITDCTFNGNTARGGYGGAMSVGTAASKLTLAGTCTFNSNTAKGTDNHYGGGLMAPSTLTVKSGAKVIFTGNECTNYSKGDAISMNYGTTHSFTVEAGAVLAVFENPNAGDTDNDICLKNGGTVNISVAEGGHYYTSRADMESGGNE